MVRIDALINDIAGTDLNIELGLTSASEAELEAVITALTSLDSLNSAVSNAWLVQMKTMMGSQTLAAFIAASNPQAVQLGIIMTGADQQVQAAMFAVYTAIKAAA